MNHEGHNKHPKVNRPRASKQHNQNFFVKRRFRKMQCLRKHSGTNAKRQIALFFSDHSFVTKLLKIVCAAIPPVYVRRTLEQELQSSAPIEFLIAIEIFKTFFRKIIAALFLSRARVLAFLPLRSLLLVLCNVFVFDIVQCEAVVEVLVQLIFLLFVQTDVTKRNTAVCMIEHSLQIRQNLR